MPHTGSTASSGAAAARAAGAEPENSPAARRMHQLGEHRDRDLLVAGAAEVEADRRPDPVEQVLRYAALGEVGEHRLAALARGDQADERRIGRDGEA